MSLQYKDCLLFFSVVYRNLCLSFAVSRGVALWAVLMSGIFAEKEKVAGYLCTAFTAQILLQRGIKPFLHSAVTWQSHTHFTSLASCASSACIQADTETSFSQYVSHSMFSVSMFLEALLHPCFSCEYPCRSLPRIL